jgi:tetratricopeptide (TPR) repeat protein
MLIRRFREPDASSPQRRRGRRDYAEFFSAPALRSLRLCRESAFRGRLIGYALIGLLSLLLPLAICAQTSRKPTAASPAGQLKVITGQAGSVVFINNVRHGTTNDKGELDLPRVKAGSFQARVRTVGYVDWNGPVVIVSNGSRTLKVTQPATGDQATLHYQKGDDLRDKGRNKDAVGEYQQALAARPVFPEVRVALARSYVTLQDFQEAEKHIQAAIKSGGRTLAEAQTVLANLRRTQGLVEESIVEYRKALRLAQNNSFEAHIGLAIALHEMSESRNDKRLIDEIAKEYRIGIAQDMETEPILYYQLGEILEKAGRNKEAIEAYRNYLRLDPEGEYASAAESVIEQLKQEPDK